MEPDVATAIPSSNREAPLIPSATLEGIVARCQLVMAHAWMVRTFVKHSEEVENFPELMQLVRTVFDVSRALETRVEDPPAYLQMLRKKLGKLRAAAEQFRTDAPEASGHMNYRQAVISMDACVDDLASLLQSGLALLPAVPSKPVGAAAGKESAQTNTSEFALPENEPCGDDTAEKP